MLNHSDIMSTVDMIDHQHLDIRTITMGISLLDCADPDPAAYQDIPGFCRSVKLEEIAQHGHVLTPGRYVGAEEVEDDDEAFADKMQKLTETLGEQMAKGAELDGLIRKKLGGLGYEF